MKIVFENETEKEFISMLLSKIYRFWKLGEMCGNQYLPDEVMPLLRKIALAMKENEKGIDNNTKM